MRLSVCDATRQPPAELREKYDVVHIRLFKPVVNNNDPGPVIEHAKALLSKLPNPVINSTTRVRRGLTVQNPVGTSNGLNSIP